MLHILRTQCEQPEEPCLRAMASLHVKYVRTKPGDVCEPDNLSAKFGFLTMTAEGKLPAIFGMTHPCFCAKAVR